MKTAITAGVTFAPGSKTLDFSGVAGFDKRRLLVVLHQPTGRTLYAAGTPAVAGSFAGSVLTLVGDMTGLGATDPLTILYEGAAADTGLATSAGQGQALTALQGIGAQLGAPLQVTWGARLPVDIGSATVTISGPVTVSNEVEIKNETGNPVPTADAGLGTDGASPPAIAGTGVRGWLRAIRDLLASTLSVKITGNAPQVTATGSLGALNAAVTLAVDGMATGVVQLAGTWAGTVSWFGSVDGGTTYFAINASAFGAGLSGPSVSTAAANGQFELATGGLTHLRATMTAYTSGSASVLISAATAGKMVRVKAPTTDPLPVQVQGIGSATLAGPTIALPAGASTKIASAGDRLFAIINSGTGNANLGFGATATVDQGFPCDAAVAAGRQGGFLSFDVPTVTAVDIFAISATGTSLVVLKG